jgi:hypothetical protein
MPKMSYAEEVAALEETLAALRVRADIVPPLALVVGEELAAQIARIKELKRRQRAYAAEGKATTAALHAAMAGGMVHAQNIRTYVVLLYGPKNPRITRFGLRVRWRPRRKAVAPPEAVAVAPGANRNAAWTAHAARANVAAVGGEALERGAEAGWDGGAVSKIGGNAPAVRAKAPGIGAFPAGIGASAPGGGGDALKIRGKARNPGANLPADQRAASQAA